MAADEAGRVPESGCLTDGWPLVSSVAREDVDCIPESQTAEALEQERRAVADRIWIWEQEQFPIRSPRLCLPRRGHRPPLSMDKILEWSDAHHAATGSWPTARSGPVKDSPFDETWRAIHSALSKGLRGLPGGSTLARLLGEHRNVRPPLTIERILSWADTHRAATGRWPVQTSGPVLGVYRENWGSIADDLREGRRGLAGGTTLARVLAEFRQVRNMHTIAALSEAQILSWADAHRRETGRWPNYQSGPVQDAPGESWSAINSALYEGWRGLPGGSSLFRLLVDHRGWAVPKRRPELTIVQILAWADAHHAMHGRWPVEESGAVAEAAGETWNGISQALARGGRGLPKGSSLARLLALHRNARNPKNLPQLSAEQILAWADAYHAAHGRWPSTNSGPVPGTPGEDWRNLDQALKKGHRGFCGGSSLARLLAAHRQVKPPRLTLETIRAWAEIHHQETGQWPDSNAGSVAAAPGEQWSAINGALRHGHRGLPGGMSLRSLFGRSLNPHAKGTRPPLMLEQVLAWAEAHHAATGTWPLRTSGAIPGAPGEKWVNIDTALYHGRRGLPSGLSLALLFDRRRDNAVGVPCFPEVAPESAAA
jgi:hypothetical protein